MFYEAKGQFHTRNQDRHKGKKKYPQEGSHAVARAETPSKLRKRERASGTAGSRGTHNAISMWALSLSLFVSPLSSLLANFSSRIFQEMAVALEAPGFYL